MQIPTQLAQWNLDVIQQLVAEDISENDQFDLKGTLDELPSKSLQASACSFANSSGGFLVFGVSEKGVRAERIIGIPRSREYLKRLQDKLAPIEPSLRIEPANPPIELSGERIVLVVEIPRSLRGPHWSPEDKRFWKRGHGARIEMSHDEVRIAFTNHAERVGRLRLVYLSLIDNWMRLEDIVAPEGGEGPVPLTIPDWGPIRMFLGDVQSLQPALIPDLFAVLKAGDVISTRCNHMFMARAQKFMDDQRSVAKWHKGEINFAMQRLRPRFSSLVETLRAEYGFDVVSPRGHQGPNVPPIPDFWRT